LIEIDLEKKKFHRDANWRVIKLRGGGGRPRRGIVLLYGTLERKNWEEHPIFHEGGLKLLNVMDGLDG
jgi:hypothetical protein